MAKLLLSTLCFCLAFSIVARADGQANDLREPKDYFAPAKDYGAVFERIQLEIMVRSENGPLLVILCFDESESMKDDQKEIRDRLTKMHGELKETGGDIVSAITSFGADFHIWTKQATSDGNKLKSAIDRIPIDKTGKELMCAAAGKSIMAGRKLWAGEGERQMMLILVTDESGDQGDIETNLERVVTLAKRSNCPVHVLGRRATFGYPFSFFRWQHPQTRRMHWIRVDRGPETAVLQSLQTNGFGPRQDGHASAFGPYAQMRLVRESGGVFFMMPSVAALPGQKEKPYRPEVMYKYRPDWRSRPEIEADVQASPLRSTLSAVIASLNPHDAEIAKAVSLRTTYSPQAEPFARQAEAEVEKTEAYLERLAAAVAKLKSVQPQREAERSGRWQASYDLARAQLVLYQARVDAYLRCVKESLTKAPEAAPTKGALRLESWRTQLVLKDEGARDDALIQRAESLLRDVIKRHPGTPWARVAEWELKRGFGVKFRPHYAPPYRRIRNPRPIPVL